MRSIRQLLIRCNRRPADHDDVALLDLSEKEFLLRLIEALFSNR